MEQFVPVLLLARKDLEEFQKQRALCFASHADIRGRTLRAALAKLVAVDLKAFRLLADGIACSAADVCSAAFVRVKGVDTAVDLFFGAVMRTDANTRTNSPSDVRESAAHLRSTSRRFMRTVRTLPHNGAAKARLDECEREFERLWHEVQKCAVELHVPAA